MDAKCDLSEQNGQVKPEKKNDNDMTELNAGVENVMKVEEDNSWGGGELLFAGSTNWETAGRGNPVKKLNAKEQERLDQREEMYPDLLGPHRFKNLLGVRIGLIAAGSSACHAVAVDLSGTKTYIWGRNEKCQLGLGDNIQRNMPVLVDSLEGQKVVSAACGRHHTVVVLDNGKSLAAGSNKQGQLGIGSMSNQKEELVDRFRECAVISNGRKVSCGTEFTIWLCGEEGKLYAAGSPEYGQLGDGSDHAYNAKEASIKIVYDPQPTPLLLKSLEDVNIVDVACGANHSIAYDTEGRIYSWGFGGYGRLGHRIQQDEHKPRQIETLTGRLTLQKNAIIGAGGASSFCTVTDIHLLFAWGKLKQFSGDSMMYPEIFQDLTGWNIRSLSCGLTTFAVAAEKSCITWGGAKNGQLGYGPDGKKTSANPDKVQALEDMCTEQVACGSTFTLFLVDPNDSKIENLPVWDCEPVDPLHEQPASKGSNKTAPKGSGKTTSKGQQASAKKGGTKRKAETKAAPKKKKIK